MTMITATSIPTSTPKNRKVVNITITITGSLTMTTTHTTTTTTIQLPHWCLC